MNFQTFQTKLKELNPKLYIDLNNKTYASNAEFGSSGIYIKEQAREEIKQEAGRYSKDIENWNNAKQDSFVAWVVHSDVPEGDRFDEQGKHIFMGWRSIVKRLVKQNIVSRNKARQVFGWEESTYDRMNYAERVRFECQAQSLGSQEMN